MLATVQEQRQDGDRLQDPQKLSTCRKLISVIGLEIR